MPFQNNSNILVAVKRETTTGVAATAASATRMRVIGSDGVKLDRTVIQSEEKTGTGVKTMGRLGGKSVTGSHQAELTVGGVTDIGVEAIARAAWVTAIAIPFASLTTLAFGTNTITGIAGDFVGTNGIRVGDIFTVGGAGANAGLNAPIVAIGSLTITTVTGAFTIATATSTGTLTVAKKVKMGTAGTSPTRYTHTIEQYDADIDLSELFLGCRLIGLKLSLQPGQMAKLTYTWMGLDRTILTTGTSPWFTSPSLTTGLDLIADDCSIRKDGVPIATFTGCDLDFAIQASYEPVIGSFVSPDVFDNDATVSGTISALRSDFANLTSYDAETEFSIGVLLQEPSGSPKAFFNTYLPRVKISQLSAPLGGNDGAKKETLTLMCGAKTAATGFDGVIATFSSSAP